MTQPPSVSAAARAEFEARRAAARREAEAAEARAMTVARRDYGLRGPAGHWANVAWWSLRLGDESEARAAFARSLDWYVQWIRYLATAGPPFRLLATDWLVVLERAVLADDPAATAASLELPVDLSDGTLTAYGRAWAAGIAALARGDDRAALEAAAAGEAVPEKTVTRDKAYPRLGSAIRHVVEGDAGALGVDLEAILESHVASARRGFRKHSESALVCVPATVLAVLAARRGLRPPIDDDLRHATIEQYRLGDPDRPASAAGVYTAEVDLVPAALVAS